MVVCVLSALGVSIVACSAESTGSPPRGSAGSTGTAGTGTNGSAGAGTVGSAGASTTGTAGAGTVGSGGTGNVGTAGVGNVGSAGAATGTAGAGTVGTAGAGAGGAAAMSCGSLSPAAGDPKCCVAAGTATDLAIDDLEDKDNVIEAVGQRQGYWYFYNDKQNNAASTTTQMPATTPFPPSAPPGTGNTSMYAAATSGSLMLATTMPQVSTYAGIGFDLNNHFMKSCGYNASAYKGITFKASATIPFKVAIKIPATSSAGATSAGTCAAKCDDNFSEIVAPPPTGAWTQITVKWNDAGFAQAGWGTPATFDPSAILGVQFQVDGDPTATGATPYSFAIDDLAFVTN